MNVLSLFSGCGGMDIGFEGGFWCLKKSINTNIHPDWIMKEEGDFVKVSPTKFNTIFANDIRNDAKQAWTTYFAEKIDNVETIYHSDSIVNLVKYAKSGENIFPQNVDVVTGGFPCQDFSVAGKRLGFHSKRSHLGTKLKQDEATNENRGQLYMWMKEVINLTSPKIFIAENVKGLVNLGDVKAVIEHDFSMSSNEGYLIVPTKVLNAKDYGVPQARERVFFIGLKKSALTEDAYNALSNQIIPTEYDPYPQKTHGIHGMHTVTCMDAFVGLEEPFFSNDLSQQKYSKAKFMGDHCQGQSEVSLHSVGPTIRSEHHGNIEFRRLSKEHGGKHFAELQEGLPERRLTVRECARLQTFPDDYLFVIPRTKNNNGISASSAYKVIGNAVPCVLAYNIAKNLEKKWFLYFGEEPK